MARGISRLALLIALALIATCFGKHQDPCAEYYCASGGVCILNTHTSYHGWFGKHSVPTCQCANEWEGERCDDNPCINVDCNTGTCLFDDKGSTHCCCQVGTSGQFCEIVDECADEPCQNGATCIDGVNEYSCTCSPGFDGENCQTNVDECADVDDCVDEPCQNGGTCQDGVNEYLCTCSPGFDGENCQTNVDECGSNPCQNDGTCLDGVDMHTCTCSPGFYGDNCEAGSVSSDKAYQSSLHRSLDEYAAIRALDGDYDTFFHTSAEENPKWWMDLEQQYIVYTVVLINRVNCCGLRLANLTVYVGNQTNTDEMEHCAYFAGPGTDGQVITLYCANKPTGSIVLLSMMNNNEPFHLAEVEVYATPVDTAN